MLLSIVATVVLQEMAARLGIISQKGLSELIRTELKNPILKTFAIILILSAIVIGNAAYEAGNISGGVLGLETILGYQNINISSFSLNLWSVLIGGIAFILLYIGNYEVLEKVLIYLVILMSLAFLITAIATKPSISEILKGVFVPKLSGDSLLTVIALIGTTVVPYNLFLHASLVKEKWQSESDLKYARKDTFVAVVFGGLVSMCIIISASSIDTTEVNSAADLAMGLEPLFGTFAKYFMGLGLFAAGITSAVTSPLAAAYVDNGCLGWTGDMRSKKFRGAWMFVLFMGVLFSTLGIESIEIIKFDQITNGILLPVIAGFLIWIMNKTNILGVHKNNLKQNILGGFILLISILLSLATLNRVFGLNIF